MKAVGDASFSRITLVVEAAGGGTGRHVLDLASELSALGLKVSVVYSRGRAEEAFAREVGGLRSVDVYAVGWPGRRVLSVGALAWFVARRKAAIHDVWHAHSFWAGLAVAIARKQCGSLTVFTPHAFRFQDLKKGSFTRRVVHRLEAYVLGRCDGLLAVSSTEEELAVGLRAVDCTVRRVLNGVSSNGFASRVDARAALGVEPKTKLIGFVGRMVPQKDPMLFAEVVELAARGRPEVVGVMVGDGPLRPAVERSAAALVSGERLRLLGAVDARRVVAGFDCLLVTSRYEGLPYAILEAVYCGVPVVSTEVGGVRDVEGVADVGVSVTGGSGELAALVVSALESSGGSSHSGLSWSAEDMSRSVLDSYAEIWRRASEFNVGRCRASAGPWGMLRRSLLRPRIQAGVKRGRLIAGRSRLARVNRAWVRGARG